MVNGRKERRVVVVLDKEGKHYRVLDLDFKARGGKEGEGGKAEEGQEGEDSSSEASIGDSDVEMGGA